MSLADKLKEKEEQENLKGLSKEMGDLNARLRLIAREPQLFELNIQKDLEQLETQSRSILKDLTNQSNQQLRTMRTENLNTANSLTDLISQLKTTVGEAQGSFQRTNQETQQSLQNIHSTIENHMEEILKKNVQQQRIMLGNLEKEIRVSKDKLQKEIKNKQHSAMVANWLERCLTAIPVAILTAIFLKLLNNLP